MQEHNSILKFISIQDSLVIDPVDGTLTIAKSKHVFMKGINRDFKNREINQTSKPTKKTPMECYELISNATLFNIFESLARDLDSLSFTQHQIIQACQQYPQLVKPFGEKTPLGHTTCFLSKIDGEYYVIYVFAYSKGLQAELTFLKSASVHQSAYKSRYIVPITIS